MKLTRILKMLLVLALSTSITSCDEFFASFDNPVPKVDPETPPEPDPNPEPTYASDLERPLTFEAVQNNVKVTFMFSSDAKPDFKKVEYSLDKGATWKALSGPNQAIILEKAGDIVMFRGENPTYNGDAQFVIETAASNARSITRKLEMSDKLAAAIGNIYSLIFGKSISGSIKLTAENANAFKNLLKDCPIDAVSDDGNSLVLPAQTLAESCYANMFAGCAEMTKAPKLPAPTLVKDCYSTMFKDCSKLKGITLAATSVEAGVKIEDCMGGILKGAGTDLDEGGLNLSWVPTSDGNGVQPGTIVVTLDDFIKYSGLSEDVTKNLTISDAAGKGVAYVPVTGIQILKDGKAISGAEVTEGDVIELYVVLSPDGATDKTVTWSSDEDELSVTFEDFKQTDQGAYVKVRGIKGEGFITASHGTLKANVLLSVEAKTYVTGVTLDKTTLSLETGATATLTATIAPSDATDKTVTWSSDKESVATVSSAGVVTAVAAGEATITVTTKDGSKTATCKVTVEDPSSILDKPTGYGQGDNPF